MKKSRNVTLALVGSALLASGCGGGTPARTLYDKAGQPVPRAQWKKADGTPNELYDDKGNLVPSDQVNSLYSSTSGSSSSSRTYGHSGGWFWGGSGWGGGSSRSYGSSGGSGSSVGGGTASRGGFGSTGGAHAGGSSSS